MSEPALMIHSAYRRELQRRLDAPKYERRLQCQPDLVLAQAEQDDVALEALVEPASHVVRTAAYRGRVSAVQRGLLEALCEVLIGRTVQEAHDHAAIRVEHLLRDRESARPVRGIVMPNNSDPAFDLVMTLARQLANDYEPRVAAYSRDNSFQEKPAEAWLQLAPDARVERLQTALAAALSEMGQPPALVQLVELEGGARLIVEFAGEYPSADKGALLMRLESALKHRIEAALQLYSTERKDINKIRRL